MWGPKERGDTGMDGLHTAIETLFRLEEGGQGQEVLLEIGPLWKSLKFPVNGARFTQEHHWHQNASAQQHHHQQQQLSNNSRRMHRGCRKTNIIRKGTGCIRGPLSNT